MPVKEIPKDWITLFPRDAHILIPTGMEDYIPSIAEVDLIPQEKNDALG